MNNLGRFLLFLFFIFCCVSVALANVSCGLIDVQATTEDMRLQNVLFCIQFSFRPLRDFVDPCQIVAFDVHVLAGRLSKILFRFGENINLP